MYAYKQATQWVIYDNKVLLPLDGGEAYNVPSQWSDVDKQNRFGLFVVLEDVVTEGMVEVSRQLIDQDGHPRLAKVLAPMTITADMVNQERDRRTYSGFSFQGKTYDYDVAKSKPNITGMGALALAAIMGGAQTGNLHWHGASTPFVWIAQDNTNVPMDAQTVLAMGRTAAAREMQYIFAAQTIKQMVPVPVDYQANSYWPSI